MTLGQTTAKASPAIRAPTVTGRPKPAQVVAAKSNSSTTASGNTKAPLSKEPPLPASSDSEILLSRINSQTPTAEPRIGLARVLSRRLTVLDLKPPYPETVGNLLAQISAHYLSAAAISPRQHDAYIELAAILERYSTLEEVAAIYGAFPFSDVPSNDDLFIASEINRIYIKLKRFKDPALLQSLVREGRAGGIAILSKYIEVLDKASENKVLIQLYAGVNGKSVDDPDMVAFFKARYWM
ncbi:hypothetical protein HKX48_003867 [Thoreauomyces humboldtii]|nr:hypothetical protein HKX48_003867 [Thoreauomyces humboldtii]